MSDQQLLDSVVIDCCMSGQCQLDMLAATDMTSLDLSCCDVNSLVHQGLINPQQIYKMISTLTHRPNLWSSISTSTADQKLAVCRLPNGLQVSH